MAVLGWSMGSTPHPPLRRALSTRTDSLALWAPGSNMTVSITLMFGSDKANDALANGDQPTAFTVLPIGFTPPVKTAAADAEISTGFGDVSGFVCVLENTKFARNLALILVHEHLLHPRNGRVMEMSREYRHIYRNCAVRPERSRNVLPI